MQKPAVTDPLFEKILHCIPSDVASTFTLTQLEELEQAVRQLKSGKHAVDVRLSIPFPKRGFYLVVMAGRERRSTDRFKAGNTVRLSHTALVGSLTTLGVLGFLAIAGVLWITQSMTAQQSVHPTAIPWLQDEASCHATGRDWHDGKCIEGEWSHLF